MVCVARTYSAADTRRPISIIRWVMRSTSSGPGRRCFIGCDARLTTVFAAMIVRNAGTTCSASIAGSTSST